MGKKLERPPISNEKGRFSFESAFDVLAVIPCLNEELHIETVVDGVLQGSQGFTLRVVVADGGSTDRTRSIVDRLSQRDGRVTLLDNPKRIQSAGVNEAVRRYGESARLLIRLDAHAEYSHDYCAGLIAAQAATGADCIVVSMRTEGHSCFQRAAAAAQNSLLGNGGASHRNPAHGRWVDHGHHALMTLSAFRSVGGYDETFSHVEDVELDNRFSEAGYRIFLSADATVTYYPRRSLTALFRQYFKIGRGRARNFLRHRRHTKARHIVLVLIAPSICLFLLSPAAPIFAVPAVIWGVVCILYGLTLGVRLFDACALASGVAAMLTQTAWSFGFFVELIATAWRHVFGISKTLARDRQPGPRG